MDINGAVIKIAAGAVMWGGKVIPVTASIWVEVTTGSEDRKTLERFIF
jgi:hypothetical protein